MCLVDDPWFDHIKDKSVKDTWGVCLYRVVTKLKVDNPEKVKCGFDRLVELSLFGRNGDEVAGADPFPEASSYLQEYYNDDEAVEELFAPNRSRKYYVDIENGYLYLSLVIERSLSYPDLDGLGDLLDVIWRGSNQTKPWIIDYCYLTSSRSGGGVLVVDGERESETDLNALYREKREGYNLD